MRSLFNSVPFQRFDLGRHALSQAIVVGPESAYSVNSILSKIGLDPSDIDKVSDPTVRAQFKAEYEKCQGKGLDSIEGIGCLAALGAKVYAKLQEDQKAPVAKLPVQQPTEFPWIPVLIGTAAAAGLIYFLATKGK